MRRNLHEDPLLDGDDFRPEDFEVTLDALDLSAPQDFVERTLSRVLAERSFAAAPEGARRPVATTAGGEVPALPAEVLATFAAPDPSADFVERTLARVIERRKQPLSDLELEGLLARHEPPRVSAGFVARTLAALHDSEQHRESALRRLRPAASRRAWLVAAAAILVIGLGAALLRGRTGSDSAAPDRGLVASTFEFSPSPVTTVFAHQNATPDPSWPDDDLDFRPLDGLTLLAAGLARSSE